VSDKETTVAAIDFALFAPYNDEAALIGDFSGWQPLPMERGDDGYFRTTVDLEDGLYKYKFRVRSKSFFMDENAWVDVVDPYATAVDDTGAGDGLVFIHEGQRKVDLYEWRHDGAPLPPDRDLVLYELHIGDFSEGGTYQGAAEKLDYLVELGVNAVELMPVNEFPGDRSWGYNPRHFFAAESSYGSSSDLKRLIDACHARGIRVILDMICNHGESETPLTQIDYEYWFHKEPKDAEHNWGPEFDYTKHDDKLGTMPARKFMGDVVRFWVSEYHIDGIRFDAVKQLDNPDFLKWVVAEAKRTAGSKPFYTVAEHIPEIPGLVGPEGPFDGTWHNSFYHGMSALLTGENRDLGRIKGLLDARSRDFPGPENLVNYLSSHDHDHLLWTLEQAGISGDEASKRARLGAVLVTTAYGIPMIWMGTEFGVATEKTIDKNKLEWPLLGQGQGRGLFEVWKGLIALRRQSAALRGESFEFFLEDHGAGVLGFVRQDESGKVVVIANLSNSYHGGYTVEGMPADGRWREWTRGYELEVRGGALTLDLPEYEAKVLVS
jgi:1,4-alpha-glucan branching enzyme